MKKYKVLIFDIDNTIIEWKDEYWLALKKTLEELNIQYNYKELSKVINDIFDTATNNKEIISTNKITNKINKRLNLNLKGNFFQIFLEYLSDCAPNELDNEISSTLEYLSKKYILYGLTNWFAYSQKNRLKKCGVLKYFKEVYGVDNKKAKPYKEAFDPIFNKYKKLECLIIGDDLKTDIVAGINLEFDSCWYNYKNQINNSNIKPTYKINKFNELKKLL